MSIYDLTVPCFAQMLQALSAQLDKGAASAKAKGCDMAVLMGARLAPDMHPLSSQVRFACIQATEAVARLRGMPGDELPNVDGLEAAKALITRTLALLATCDRMELEAGAEWPIELVLPNGMTFEMNGFDYVRNWAIPQFYFHVVTAYGILRHHGVELGKADYVPHMFAYLRPANQPEA